MGDCILGTRITCELHPVDETLVQCDSRLGKHSTQLKSSTWFHISSKFLLQSHSLSWSWAYSLFVYYFYCMLDFLFNLSVITWLHSWKPVSSLATELKWAFPQACFSSEKTRPCILAFLSRKSKEIDIVTFSKQAWWLDEDFAEFVAVTGSFADKIEYWIFDAIKSVLSPRHRFPSCTVCTVWTGRSGH